LVVDGELEFFAQRAGMGVGDTRDEYARFRCQDFRGYFDDLFRRFAAAKNDFGETFAERAVRVHPREAEVGHRCGLERPQDLVAAHSACAELFEKLDGFGGCHGRKMA
jgi:hypothetical protein